MALAFCALAIVSCKKELNDDPAKEGTTIFSATSEMFISDSKTAITDDGVCWVKDDAVSIFWGTDGKATGYATESGKTSRIQAENVGEADVYYAFYPASDNVSFSEGAVTFTVPTEATGAFADANMTYAATTKEDKAFAFKNLTGLVHFSVSSEAVTKVVFKATAPVAGTVSASFDDAGNIVLGTASNTSETITIPVGESREAYFSVLAGAALENGFVATCYNADGAPVSVANGTSAMTVARAQLWDLGTIDAHAITNYFVTPAGAGKKTGKNWDNALDVESFKEMLTSPVDDAEAAAVQAVLLDGVTFHIAAGDYILADSEVGCCKVDFTANGANVKVNLIGGYPAGLTGKTTDGRDPESNVTAFSGEGKWGILTLGNYCEFSFSGITFKNAHSNNQGYKAFSIATDSSVEGATCAIATFMGCSFIDNIEQNTSPSGMGAVVNRASATFNNCVFSGNKSRNGSALIMSNGAIVSAKECDFLNNDSYNTSGAVQNGGGTLNMEGCRFTGNTASKDYSNIGYGGAFHSNGEGAVSTLKDCLFKNNNGFKGGAISMQKATLTLEDCIFSENISSAAASEAQDYKPKDDNRGGGAIFVDNAAADLTVRGCTFTENTATNTLGGAIFVNASKEVKLFGSTFTSNSALYFGGAVFHKSGKLTVAKNGDTGCTFSQNYTVNEASGDSHGGAVYLSDKTTATVDGASFTGNYTPTAANYGGSGGGLYLAGVTSVEVTGCTFSGNVARNGGGLFCQLSGSSACNITDCDFTENRLESANTRRGAGAGISYGTAVFTRCNFTDNYSNGGSGAFHVNNANAHAKFVGCTFSRNTSDGNGGVAVVEDGTVEVDGCTFTENSSNNGGCFRVEPKTADKTTVTFKNSTFSKCKAGNTGAGLALVGSVAYKADVDNCSFNECEAYYAGAAIHIGNNSGLVANIKNSTIYKNKATRTDNNAYPATRNEGAKANFDNCVFDSNYGVKEDKARGIAFSGANNSKTTFNKCKFIGNNNGNRGVIFLDGNALTYFNDCLFYNNNVKQAWGNCFHIGATNGVLMNGCTFYNNPGQYDINGDGYFLIANSTVVSKATGTAFRQGAADKKVLVVNNIFDCKSAAKTFDLKTAMKNDGYNIMNNNVEGSGYTTNTSDYKGAVPGASYDDTAGKYLWNGPAGIPGFTMATATVVKNAIKNDFNVTVCGVSNVGNDFCTWVESVGGFRSSTNWWPGAYQAQ